MKRHVNYNNKYNRRKSTKISSQSHTLQHTISKSGSGLYKQMMQAKAFETPRQLANYHNKYDRSKSTKIYKQQRTPQQTITRSGSGLYKQMSDLYIFFVNKVYYLFSPFTKQTSVSISHNKHLRHSLHQNSKTQFYRRILCIKFIFLIISRNEDIASKKGLYFLRISSFNISGSIAWEAKSQLKAVFDDALFAAKGFF